MKKKLFIFVAFIIILSIIFAIILKSKTNSPVKKGELMAEHFIKNHLTEENGLIKNDLLEESHVYLSESIGLWMTYLVEKKDKAEFDLQANLLQDYFMEDNYLISWRLINTEKASSNALIDDLRIISSLIKASETWGDSKYHKLAMSIAKDVSQYNMVNDNFINHVDIETKYQGDFLTLSYLDPEAIRFLHEEKLITEEQYLKNREILIQAPISEHGFFPLTYYPDNDEYEFATEVNLIDQYYVGYYRALWDGDVSSLVRFTEETLEKYDNILFGRFSADHKKPTVDYEGASVYALAILMCLEVEEYDLVHTLMESMKGLQISDSYDEYYGGYIDVISLDTHAFDNLLPLLAERKALDEGINK
ncbi:endo-1,4-beta-D-glucanase Y [Gracilibacillus halotolerans]|uniref:Endo-1,4-beta-D-glucanase Y n=1 Tax=Gracilibacillus halotolerans TaxID=74386 RepID=A0A841RN30_9BACI|nr:glycosyl hydrolase family 8 [Gracilibacillus halotolerans]MBB6512846.1 endo-1,4-beta-D-glucanase Y [Gracilibacillus halotolerans]